MIDPASDNNHWIGTLFRHSIRILVGLTLLFVCSGTAVLSDESSGETTEKTTDSVITDLRARIEGLRSLLTESEPDESSRRAVAKVLDRADEDLKLAEKQEQVLKKTQAETKALSEEVTRLSLPTTVDMPEDVKGLSQPELETMLASGQVSLTGAETKLAELEAVAVDPAAAKRSLTQQEATVAQAISQVEEDIQELPADANDASQQADRFALIARGIRLQFDRQVIQASLAEIDAEIALNLPSLRVNSQKQKVQTQKTLVDALKAEAERRRRAESTEQLAEARSAEKDPSTLSSEKLRELVTSRTEYAAVNQKLVARQLPAAERRLKQKSELIAQIEIQRQKIQNRIKKFGATGTIGQDLLYFHNRFPKRLDLRREISEIDGELAEIRPKVLDYSDELDSFELIAAEVSESPDVNADDLDFIEGYRKLLKTVKDNTVRLASMLSDLDGENRRILAVMDEWGDYVSEHAMWFRSHEPLKYENLLSVPANSRVATKDFADALSGIGERQGPVFITLIVLSIVVFVILVTVQNRAKEAIRVQGDIARKPRCNSMRPTLRTLLLTSAIASEWPLLCMLLGYLLHSTGGDGWKAGTAMIQLGGVTLWMNCLRHTVRKGGLAEAHFRWNSELCGKLGGWVHLLIAVTIVPLFCLLFVRLFQYADDSLSRILFIILMLLLCGIMARLFLPVSNPFVRQIGRISPFVRRTRWLWVGIPIVIPLLLAVISAMGYHYTAVELSRRVSSTIVALSVVLLAHQLLVRWLRVSATRTRLQVERQRAEEAAAAAAARAEAEADGEVPVEDTTIPPLPEEDVDLELFGLQADALARNASLLVALACTWAIWADVLPALRLLDREPLWYVTVERPVDVPADTTGAEDADKPVEQVMETVRRPVTVGSLLFAVFALVMTVMAVRQLPGLLEIVLQSGTALDAGMRYTICTVVRYLVLFIGAMVVCASVGLRWGQVQWLVAGLSVGLGFGLQEVFANFVSGLIILVERPVRIGDIVTIDGVSGIVSRIRIRATSITDWDRREYIVPNREFVTGKLLNWTLSDTTNRIMVHVGISYSADPDRAREIMLEVAADHPNVMEDPAPITSFEAFGDSSLALVLRAYLPSMDDRLGTITQLHTEINRRFVAEGIEIPFPQRDLHIRSSVVSQLPPQ